MPEAAPSPQTDLSYLRALAEAGRNAPTSAGAYLVAGGGWFGLAALVIGLGDIGVLPAAATPIGPVLLVATAAFAATLVVLIRRDAGTVATDANRIIGAAWSSAGLGIFFFFLACMLAAVRLGTPDILNAISLFVLTVYALAWRISACVTRQGWMNGVAGLTLVSLGLAALAVASPYLWLAYAGGLVLSGVIPGLFLIRRARAMQSPAR